MLRHPFPWYLNTHITINGTYTPHSDWTNWGFTIAFLVKAYGGPRLLYTMQVAEGYPSLMTLQQKKSVLELTVSESEPDDTSICANLSAFLGPASRKPPSNSSISQVLMIDSITVEEVCNYDLHHNCILGLCWEYTHHMDLQIGTYNNLRSIKHALQNKKQCHVGKDGTVVSIALVMATEHYFISLIALSASCKTKNGQDLSTWILKLLKIYEDDENGQKQHAPIWILTTNGESTFCNLRFHLSLLNDFDWNSEVGCVA